MITQVSDYCGEAFDNNTLRDSILEQIMLSEIHNRKFTKIQMNYPTMLVATEHYIPYDSGQLRMWGLEIEIVKTFHDGLFSLAGEVYR